jgi:two-component system nitrogen regulation response regulator NtrX
MSRPFALIIDDNPDDIELVSAIVRSDYDVDSVTSCRAGLERLSEQVPDIVLLDLHFPDGEDGLRMVTMIKERQPSLPIIVVTESNSTLDAVECVRAGAFHFIEKTALSKTVLLSLMSKAVAERASRRAAESARVEAREAFGEIIGRSPAILETIREIEKVAPTDASVLITGDSGTGKELVARKIHEASKRRDRPLVAVACPAIPANLMESEFFGVATGAFTGAVAREGRLDLADGGTLFLDEVADLEFGLQTKLLRALEEGTFERVGDRATMRVDARVISATSRDIPAMVSEGRFRQELYHRLNTYPVHVPPLRDRLEDVPLLLEHFVARYAADQGKPTPAVDPGVVDRLQSCSWSQNNVRELRNCVEAAVIRCRGDTLHESDFRLLEESDESVAAGGPFLRARDECVAGFERQYVERVLSVCDGNITRAARHAGVSRRTMSDLVKRTGLSPRRPRDK